MEKIFDDLLEKIQEKSQYKEQEELNKLLLIPDNKNKNKNNYNYNNYNKYNNNDIFSILYKENSNIILVKEIKYKFFDFFLQKKSEKNQKKSSINVNEFNFSSTLNLNSEDSYGSKLTDLNLDEEKFNKNYLNEFKNDLCSPIVSLVEKEKSVKYEKTKKNNQIKNNYLLGLSANNNNNNNIYDKKINYKENEKNNIEKYIENTNNTNNNSNNNNNNLNLRKFHLNKNIELNKIYKIEVGKVNDNNNNNNDINNKYIDTNKEKNNDFDNIDNFFKVFSNEKDDYSIDSNEERKFYEIKFKDNDNNNNYNKNNNTINELDIILKSKSNLNLNLNLDNYPKKKLNFDKFKLENLLNNFEYSNNNTNNKIINKNYEKFYSGKIQKKLLLLLLF